MEHKTVQQNESPSSEMMPPEGSDPKPATKTSRKKLFLLVVISLSLFVILSIGLGAGLGLGLKHNGKSVPSSTSSPSPSAPATSTLPSWRRDPSEYILDMDSWDINAPPTTRHFDFTVSEIEGYPDGELLEMRARRHFMMLTFF